jgi:hypothetical protein
VTPAESPDDDLVTIWPPYRPGYMHHLWRSSPRSLRRHLHCHRRLLLRPQTCPRLQPRRTASTSRRSLGFTPGVPPLLLLPLQHHRHHQLLLRYAAPPSSLHHPGSSRMLLRLVLFLFHRLTTTMA